MKYLIDTNIVISYLRSKGKIVIKVRETIKNGYGISSVSLAELYLGAEKSKRVKHNYQQINKFLKIPAIKELKTDKRVAQEYGKLMAALERKGIRLDGMDVLIAATAKANNLVILTEDKKHFGRLTKFGLNVEVVE